MEKSVIQIVRFNAQDQALLEQAFMVRQVVFVDGQDCPTEEEFDGFDDQAVQFLAYVNGHVAGTARMRETRKGIKLERFAVLEKFRGMGVGFALVREATNAGRSCKGSIYLHAQSHALKLYEKLGYRAEGAPFDEVGIEHYTMVLNE